ncbi:MAG: hypothetical protein V3U54_08740 [Thermodesulfobacteriota bacterium]
MNKLTNHKCIRCYGHGNFQARVGNRIFPVTCTGCDGTGKVSKETFMKQVKNPTFKTNNLSIVELYEGD